MAAAAVFVGEEWASDGPTEDAVSSQPTASELRGVISEIADALHDTFAFPRPFDDKGVEADFRRDFARRFVGYRRAAMLLGALLWLAFLPMDYHAHSIGVFTQERFQGILAIRVGVFLVLVPLVVATFTPSFKNELFATVLICIGIGIASSGALGLVAIVPSPADYNYFFAVPVLLVFIFAFAHLRAAPASILGLAIGLVLIAWVVPLGALGKNSFSAAVNFMAVYIFCHGVGVKIERYARERFIRVKELAAAVAEEKSASRLANAQRKKADENMRLLVQLKEQQRTDAERASAEKSRFLAEAAHDLRQPMQAISSLVDAASHALATDREARARELIDDTLRAIRVMRTSFNSVLEISRLDSRMIEPKYAVFDVQELIADVVIATEPIAQKKGVEIRTAISGTKRIYVRSDRQLLSRLLANLVTNGIKYSKSGAFARKRVLIGCVCLPTRVRLDVVDNGIGIAREHWERIFAPFFQVDNPGHDREKGLGLGLSIVNAIVSILAEHRIEMRSAEGRGTRFTVDIPIARIEKFENQSGISGEDERTLDVEGVYLILVEDDALVRRSLTSLLEQHGALVEAVESLSELGAVMESMVREPDLVITDYRLSDGETALEVLNHLREEFGPGLPAIVLTGEMFTADAVEYPPRTSVLQKPIASSLLLKQIAEVRRAI